MSAQVSIGNGEITTQNLPINPFYGYNYSQSIYLASEINASGDITAVKYYVKPGTALDDSIAWEVFIGHTTKSSFENDEDWIAVTDDMKKFEGDITLENDIVTITFTSPFTYNGTDNLFVAVNEGTPSWDSSGDDFYTTAISGDRSIYERNDSENQDELNPPTADGTVAYIPNITFEGIQQACPFPTDVVVSNITNNSADVTWTTGGATAWEVLVLEATADAPEMDATGFMEVTDATSYTAMTLNENTEYIVYVRDNCGGEKSSWTASIAFTTLFNCPVSTDIVINDITLTEAEASWTTGGATSWKVLIQDASLDAPTDDATGFTLVENTPNYLFTSLNPAAAYIVYVKDVCDGGLGESFWAASEVFNTPCDTFTVDADNSYTYGFEDDQENCWEYTNEGTGNDWSFTTTASYVSEGEKALRYGYSSSNAANVWAYTRGLNLTAGDVIEVTFDYRVRSATYSEKLKVTVGTEKTVASQATTLWDNNGGDSIDNIEFEQGVMTYTVPTTDTYYFAFNCYSDANKWDVYIDNVSVHIAPSCLKPSDVTVDNVTNDTADVTWTTGGATDWQVLVLEATAEEPTGDATGFEDVTGTAEHTVSGLNENTEYVVYVRDNCGSEQSFWEVSETFTTLYNCPVSTEVEVSNITETTADISWTTGGATSWKVLIQEASLDAPAADATGFDTVDTTPTFNATSLISATSYSVYIKDVCEGELGESFWTEAVTFSTQCDAFTVDMDNAYGYSFEEDEAECWTFTNEGTGNDWNYYSLAAYVSDGLRSLRYNYSFSDAANAWAYSRALELTAGDVIEVKFDYRVRSATYGEKLKVTIGNEMSVAAQTNTLWDNNGADELVNVEFEEGIASYTVAESGTYYVAFNCYSDAGQWDLYVDNVSVTVTGQEEVCNVPTGVIAENITETTADISWTTGGATSWEVIVVESSATMPESGEVVDVATYNATALTANTEYKVYVRDICDADNDLVSEWTEMYTFMTLDEATVDCNVPTGVDASNITETTADITWTTGGATSWEIIVVESSATMPESGETVDATTYNATSLTANTIYNVYVRDICDADNDIVSEWTEVYSFTTAEIGIAENVIEGLKVYPNPSKDIVFITSKEEITTVEVYNTLGQVVMKNTVNSTNFKLDLYNLSQGSYTLKLTTDSTVASHRIMKN